MAFCPKCKSEFRTGFERCEECDAALVGELPAPPAAPPEPPNPGFRTVYSTTELSDAILIGSLLEGNGIDAEVENQSSGLYAIGFPTSATPIEVTVPADDFRTAEGIVEEALKARSTIPGDHSKSRRMWMLAIAILALPILATLLFELFYRLGNRRY